MNRRDFIRVSCASITSVSAWHLSSVLSNHSVFALGNVFEGKARLLSPDYAVAGDSTALLLEFTVGSSGIPVGGGIAIGIHHAAYWRPMFQVQSPDAPAYVHITGPSGTTFNTSYHEWFPHDKLALAEQGLFSDAIFHKVILAEVEGAALNPMDKVIFHFGQPEGRSAAHASVSPDHEFRVMSDTTGDGVYQGITASPVFDIIPNEPDHLTAFCSAQIKTNQPFQLQVQAEDRFFNVVRDHKGRTGYNGTVQVSDEDGTVLAESVSLENGIGHVTLQVDTAGPRRFRVTDGVLEGRSNPCKAFDVLPKYKIYWGDIHGHTGVSDGLGRTCAEYFAYGRDIACLDVCALSDHGHFDWPQNIQAVKDFYEPERYVTILAQEAGAKQDHVNYYFRHDDTPHVERWTTDYQDLQEIILKQYNSGEEPEVIAGPHHFAYARGDDRYPFEIWDSRVCRFVEVYSSHGTSEFLGNPRPLNGPTAMESKFMQYGLEKGLHFGVIGSSDNHDSRPGRTIWGHYPGGLVAFLAPELTREAIWQSLWKYQTYGTSMDRIYIEFTIDDQIMGSEIYKDGPVTLAYEVIGKSDGVTVELLKNNQVIRTDETDAGMVQVTLDDEPAAPESFYYLRVTQDNGERAWSSPVWVVRT